MFGNVRSLCTLDAGNNRIDELQACVRYLYEYRESGLICVTETWLKPHITGDSLNIDGFTFIRADRSTNPQIQGWRVGSLYKSTLVY
jgi:hypothetical protein